MASAMLDKTYRPAEVEAKLYRAWEEGGGFGCAPDSNRRPFTIMMPPTVALFQGRPRFGLFRASTTL